MTDKWTTANIPDLTGKVMVVTGANSGIGFDSAREFARNGAHVVLACRNMTKAQNALDALKAEIPEADARIMQLDLANLQSVHEFAAIFKSDYERLDVLLNNAGIMMSPYGTTGDGFESQFGTNHLGHFALTGLLLDMIVKTPYARVVNVYSMGHHMGKMDFDNLMFKNGKGYSPTSAYGRSKLANLLFTYELQRFFEANGVDAIALAAHPGTSSTNLTRYIEDKWYFNPFGVGKSVMNALSQSSEMGALPLIRASVDPDAKGGECYGPDGFMQQRGYPVVVQTSKASHNKADAKKLWEVSEQLTGVEFALYDHATEA